MALSLYRAPEVSGASYATPPIAGLIVTSLSVAETTSPTEFKDAEGNVIAVAVPDPIQEISFEGMRTGNFTMAVGALLSITMPESVELGETTIVTGLTTNFASESFETISGSARSYKTAMSAAA
jgi:hypothetical protein